MKGRGRKGSVGGAANAIAGVPSPSASSAGTATAAAPAVASGTAGAHHPAPPGKGATTAHKAEKLPRSGAEAAGKTEKTDIPAAEEAGGVEALVAAARAIVVRGYTMTFTESLLALINVLITLPSCEIFSYIPQDDHDPLTAGAL